MQSYNIFTGCPQAKTCTFILRGGAEQFIEETERSLHDAIMIVRRAVKNDSIVAGESRKNLIVVVIVVVGVVVVVVVVVVAVVWEVK